MSMRVVKVNDANARFEKREQKIAAECEELSEAIASAIESVDVDTKNRWSMYGFSTCRVAYVDASSYLPQTIDRVAQAYSEAGYKVNHMSMEMESEDSDATTTMEMMAILWEPSLNIELVDRVIAADAEEDVTASEDAPTAAEDEDVKPETTATTDAAQGEPEADGEVSPEFAPTWESADGEESAGF